MGRYALLASLIGFPVLLAMCERAPLPAYTPIVYPSIPSSLPPTASASSSPADSSAPLMTPSLVDHAVFEFFAESGTFEIYSILGRLVKREDDETSFRNGGVRFIQVGPSDGIISGNGGAGDVEVRRTDRTLSFIERNSFHLNVLTIEDHWLADKRGFAATYSRNIENPLKQERMMSIYSGVAVPPASRKAGN